MITLITGTPGAGKTLYAIAKLLLPVLGKSVVEHLDDGTDVEHPHRIYTNINGFQIDHDLIEAGPAWVFRGGQWEQAEGHRQGVHNWHQWAPPGAVIAVDEFQKLWPPRPNGAPVPPDVQAMDTHRHMGVDFVLISQKFSFDSHIVGLIGRHIHIRRIGNFNLAIVYEWDHCSRSLLYSKSISKSPFRFKREWFKLYVSARVHTKQQRKTPTLAYVVIGAAALAAWKIPESYSRITGKAEAAKQVSSAPQSAPGRAAGSPVTAVASAMPTSAVVPPVPWVKPEDPVVGCVQSADACRCFDAGGVRVAVEPHLCEARVPQGGAAKVPPQSVSLQDSAAVSVSTRLLEVDGEMWSSLGVSRGAR